MRRTGAFLARYALEKIGVRWTFGIPGIHNTELYDELARSETIEPILVTHEAGASFMADAVSRVSSTIGTLAIVPAAGTAYAMAGMGEAFLDGIPMLVISGGFRRDSGRSYQVHQMDLGPMVQGVVKGYFLVRDHSEVVPTIFEAWQLALAGEPGPVFVEIPAEILMFEGEIAELADPPARSAPPEPESEAIDEAVELLARSQRPGIYIGWGGVDAFEETRRLAERLSAPVATTLQGLSAFPASHPLHVGMSFGPASPPAAEEAFADCDCLLAVGVRFSELATGSYGVPVPKNLIHIDINREVFNRNYPARVALLGDATRVLSALNRKMDQDVIPVRDFRALADKIAASKAAYLGSWCARENRERVSPGQFFSRLRKILDDDAVMVADDGNHTFLAAELFPVRTPRRFLSPTDFNCMGYAVPAAIGAKLALPEKQVVAVVGDGAFLMTGMELLTATAQQLGVIVFVFRDGELGQIAQFQEIPLKQKTCTVLPDYEVEGFAMATGAAFLALRNDLEIDDVLGQAFQLSEQGRPVLVEVQIDYSRKTRLTKGVVRTNLARFPMREKIRFLARAAKRHLLE